MGLLEWIAIGAIAGALVWAITKDKRWGALAALIPLVGRVLLEPSESEQTEEEPYDDPPEDDVEDVPNTDDGRPIDDYVQDVHRRGTEGD